GNGSVWSLCRFSPWTATRDPYRPSSSVPGLPESLHLWAEVHPQTVLHPYSEEPRPLRERIRKSGISSPASLSTASSDESVHNPDVPDGYRAFSPLPAHPL